MSGSCNRVPRPWLPVEAEDEQQHVCVSVWGREYRQEAHSLPTRWTTQGVDVLAAPVRLSGEANGEPIVWEDEGCYLLEADDTKACVNGYAQSQCLIVNSSFRVEYDGGVHWDLRILPRGKTVPQVFGLEPCPIKGWSLTRLCLQIPLRKDVIRLYNTWMDNWVGSMNGVRSIRDGAALAENGRIPEGGLYAPFCPALWLGDERVGLQLTAESDESWEATDRQRMVEILDNGDHWVLQLNLLNHAPRSWENPDDNCPALLYSFGLILTPVKPFDAGYLKWNAVHIDCFTKIKGDYWTFLNGPVSEENPERVIDRLSRAGVNLLILHEKWNALQKNWNVPVNRAREIHSLVRLCHKRGIRVIPYFGYEITSAMSEYNEVRNDVTAIGKSGKPFGALWYRVPYQRASVVCYRSAWADRFVEGVLQCVDTFHFDGIYLDSTTRPAACCNERHGCGYTDEHGERHVTYPIFAVRDMMKTLCNAIHDRGGIVNPHPAGATIPLISSFADMLWDGEQLQTRIRTEGLNNFSLDYIRAEYLGANLGIPVQFIVYEQGDVWNFDMALSLCLIHGIYPRPNSIWHPLDVMERIWSIIHTFGVSDAAFHGYWEAGTAAACSGAVKVSYYVREQVDSSVRLLLMISNPTMDEAADCQITLLPEVQGRTRVAALYDCMENRALPVEGGLTMTLKPYSYRIIEAVLS